MKAVGTFEIKARLSQIREEVAKTGESVHVTRRGKPSVRIEPIALSPRGSAVLDSRDEFLSSRPLTDDFVVPERTADTICSPLGPDDA